jgi:hypothetical protein
LNRARLQYLGEKSAAPPRERRARYVVLQWLAFKSRTLDRCSASVGIFWDAPRKIPYAIDRYRNETLRLYSVMERRLGQEEYLGGRYSIADMATWPWVHVRWLHRIELAEFPNVQRWYEAIGRRPAVQWGIAVLAERMKIGNPDQAARSCSDAPSCSKVAEWTSAAASLWAAVRGRAKSRAIGEKTNRLAFESDVGRLDDRVYSSAQPRSRGLVAQGRRGAEEALPQDRARAGRAGVKRNKWVADFLERIQTRGTHIHYDQMRKVRPENFDQAEAKFRRRILITVAQVTATDAPTYRTVRRSRRIVQKNDPAGIPEGYAVTQTLSLDTDNGACSMTVLSEPGYKQPPGTNVRHRIRIVHHDGVDRR